MVTARNCFVSCTLFSNLRSLFRNSFSSESKLDCYTLPRRRDLSLGPFVRPPSSFAPSNLSADGETQFLTRSLRLPHFLCNRSRKYQRGRIPPPVPWQPWSLDQKKGIRRRRSRQHLSRYPVNLSSCLTFSRRCCSDQRLGCSGRGCCDPYHLCRCVCVHFFGTSHEYILVWWRSSG